MEVYLPSALCGMIVAKQLITCPHKIVTKTACVTGPGIIWIIETGFFCLPELRTSAAASVFGALASPALKIYRVLTAAISAEFVAIFNIVFLQ